MTLSPLTPRHLVIAARLALPPSLGAMAGTVLVVDGSPIAAAAATFVTATVLLLAAPRVRAAELLGCLALFATILEWTHASLAGGIDAARWQAAIAVAGAMALHLKVQHWRSLARQDPYVSLRQLERRSVLFGRTARRPDPAPRPTRRIA